VAGHLNHYAITDNSERCNSYVYHATQALFKWINRKSQRPSYIWDGFRQALNHVGWPKPIIRKDLNPCRRLQAIWMVSRRAGCMGNPLVRFCEGLGNNRRYGWNIVAPPGNQAVNRENKPEPTATEGPSLLDNSTEGFLWLLIGQAW